MKTIKLMADYFCFPLWVVDPVEVGNVNPESLPISQGLKDMLLNWAKEYDRTVDMDDPSNSGFKSQSDELKFKKTGARLADLLTNELGSGYVVKFQFN